MGRKNSKALGVRKTCLQLFKQRKTRMTVYGAVKHSSIPRKMSRSRVTGKVRVNAKAGQRTVLAKNKDVESAETFQILALLDQERTMDKMQKHPSFLLFSLAS